MKKINFAYIILILLGTSFLHQSCMPDTYLGPDPVEGSIVRFFFSNTEATVIMGDSEIYATLPRNTDLTSLVPEVLISLGAVFVDFEPGKPFDFTGPVKIKVKGTDNVINTYTIIAEVAEASPGFAEVNELFEIRHESLPGAKANDLRSMAISGDQIILLTSTNILYFDATNGTLLGNTGNHYGLNRLATDAKGRIIGTNSASSGGTMRLYKMGNVNEAPVQIFSSVNSADGQFGNGAQVSVYGDIEKDAVIFTPIWRNAKTTQVHRWTIKNGQLSSPELITYSYISTSKPPYGNIGFAMSAGPNETDGYILGDRAESSYFKNGSRFIFNDQDLGLYTYGGPGGGKVFTMNGATYYAVWRANLNKGGLFNILDITRPEAIAMSKADRAKERINFMQFESETFRINSAFGQNASMRAGVDVKYLENGNVILYFMYDNAGIKAFELIKDIHF